MLDLSSLDASAADIERLRDYCAYQPFVLPGGTVTGAGLSFIKQTAKRYSDVRDEEAVRGEFLRAAKSQAQMYEDVIDFTAGLVGGFAGKTVLDFACNAGYLTFRASQLGAAIALGIDKVDYSEAFAMVNRALGTAALFRKGEHDMATHRISGAESEFDVVMNVAYMIHVSDPTFLLAELAKKAKRALVLLSSFTRDDGFQIVFHPQVRRYWQRRFPLCFDGKTQMSDGLLKFALTDLGFGQIHEVPRNSPWPLREPTWRAFVAIR
jgi:2-polyprenyl-3-methyl-5-hydroxy-6-metoxy-1,4-benzoquinol methylase